jgi:phospholipid transport system substrate-binding protein
MIPERYWQNMKLLSVFLALLLIVCHPVVRAASAENVIQQTSRKVLDRLAHEREKLESDPEYLQTLVEELIIPQFDFDKMSRLVLGNRWNEIDEQSRACFTRGFSKVLIERYADILLRYDNQTITYEPARPVGESEYVSVRQTISRRGARSLPVDYPLRRDGDNWKVVDIIVDGASLIRNYRGIYQYEINRQGLEGFIQNFPECAHLK